MIAVQPEDGVYRDPVLHSGLMFAVRNLIPTFKTGQVLSFTNDVYTMITVTSSDLITLLAITKYSPIEDWIPLLNRLHAQGETLYRQYKDTDVPFQNTPFKEFEIETRVLLQDYSLRLTTHRDAVVEEKPSSKAADKKASSKLQDTGLW